VCSSDLTPIIFKFISKFNQEYAVLVAACAFCFILSAFSIKAGLAPIVGAFCAGLALSTLKQREEIKIGINPLYSFFTPIFFVMMGTNVDISIFNPFISQNREILFLASVLFIVAFAGKTAAGWAVLKKGVNKLLIGVAMVPRGEVGLIFASLGFQSAIFSKSAYSALVVVIMLTTLVTPIALKHIINKTKET
jgi:Kef-type K+ transport system membrane component KefB